MLKPIFILAAASALLPVPTLAQGLPDLGDSVTQSDQLGRTAQASVIAARPRLAEGEGNLPGEAGVYVLTVNKIFSITGSGALGYTNNPDRNADNVGGDGFAEGSFTAGLSTRVGEMVDFGMRAGVGGREYFERASGSNRNVSGNVSAGLPLSGPVYFGVVAFGGWNLDSAFENPVGFYGAGVNLSAALPLSKSVVLRPGLAVNRQISEVSENNSTTLSAGLEAFVQAAPAVSLSARANVSRRWFDNFYEDATFVKRKDWNYSLAASATWQPLENVVLGASVGYEKQSSTFFLSAFEAWEGAVLASVMLRF